MDPESKTVVESYGNMSHLPIVKNRDRCAICYAYRNSFPDRRFFQFPKDPEMCRNWVAACHRPYLLKKTPQQLYKGYKVCSLHFIENDFASTKFCRLIKSACPSQFISDAGTTSDVKLDLLSLKQNIRKKLNSSRSENSSLAANTYRGDTSLRSQCLPNPPETRCETLLSSLDICNHLNKPDTFETPLKSPPKRKLATFIGRPSELTDVENIDWAPTLKMGKSRIRLKGNNVKKEMFGFSSSERRRIRKLTKWTETNSLIQTIIPTSSKTDIFEMDERMILASEAIKVENKKYYKCKKNPWSSKREIDNQMKENEEERWKRDRMHTSTTLKRKKYFKMSNLRKMQDQGKEARKIKRSAIAIDCIEDDQSDTFPQFIKHYKPVITHLSSTSPPSKSPLIHRISIDTHADKNTIQTNTNLRYDFGIQSSAESNENIKHECVVPFTNKCTLQSANEHLVQSPDISDAQSENIYDQLFENAFNLFDKEYLQIKEELNNHVKKHGGIFGPVSICIAPSANEIEQIIESMNEQCPDMKEFKEELL